MRRLFLVISSLALAACTAGAPTPVGAVELPFASEAPPRFDDEMRPIDWAVEPGDGLSDVSELPAVGIVVRDTEEGVVIDARYMLSDGCGGLAGARMTRDGSVFVISISTGRRDGICTMSVRNLATGFLAGDLADGEYEVRFSNGTSTTFRIVGGAPEASAA